MAVKTYPLFSNFSSGETTPKIDGRIDLGQYFNGVKELKNFLCVVQGGVKSRGGFHFAGEIKNSGEARLIPFIFFELQNYMFEFGNQYIRFWMNCGQLMDNGNPYEIASPYLIADDLWSIRFVQDDEYLYLVHPLYHPQVLTRGGSHTSFTIGEMDFIDGPYEDEINTPNITPSHSAVGGERVQNGGFDTDTIWTKGANWTISGGKASKSAGAANNLSQDTTEAATEIYKVIYTIDSISGGNLTASIGGVSGSARSAAGTYTEYITATGTGDLTFTPSAAGVVCQIDNVSVIRVITLTASIALFQTGHVGALWRIKHSTDTWGYVKIDSYVSATVVRAVVKTVLGATTASTGHRESSWSDVNGWPRAICFHEGKLLFGGNYEHPQTVWGSKSRKYSNFTPGILDNDAYSFTASDLNIIRWMVPTRVLCIGALNAEATVVGPNDGPITAVDPPRIKSETTHGSSDLIAPVRVGKAILFLQKAARKIREFVYSYTEDAYGAPDLTIASEHLFTSDLIDLVYQQEPDSLLWGIRAGDGSLVVCAYDRYMDPTKGGIVGWSRNYTDGVFESLATIPYQEKDQLWSNIRRKIPPTERVTNGSFATDTIWTKGANWTISGGVAIHTAGSTETLSQDTGEVSGKIYEVTFEVLSMTAGSITMSIGGVSGTARSKNGTFTEVITATGTENLTFTPTSAFNGSLDDVSVIVVKRYMEYYDPDIYVDSGLTYSGAPITQLSGLGHLEGKTVEIVGDGAPYNSQIIPSNGEITLEYPPASEIYIGLGYTPRLVTNRPEVNTGAGTSQGLKKRWSKIIVRVLETTGVKINGQVVESRRPSDLMGEAPGPFTGDVNVENLGWDKEGRITIEQPLPLPAHIVAIFGTLLLGED